MRIAWKSGTCLAFLLLGPLSAGAATPMVAANTGTALALKSDGTVAAWGRNDYGQLGNGQAAIRVSPGRVAGIDQVRAVAAGTAFTLGLRTDGTLWSWGTNLYGELGDGTRQIRAYPVRVTGISGTIASIAASDGYALAATSDGRLWAWGANGYGQLGTGDRNRHTAAVRVAGLQGVRAVAAGGSHALALDNDGTVWAWGDNTSGQLGNGTTTDSLVPIRVSALAGILAISAHQRVNLALDASGRVWAWGRGIRGSLGDGTTNDRATPFIVPGLPRITEIRAGQVISTAVAAADGSVWAWGHNEFGEFGDSRYVRERSPTSVTNLRGLNRFGVGGMHMTARDSSGAVQAWGRNDKGQLGLGDVNDRAVPTPIPALPQIAQVAAGETHTVAVANDGSVWAWGAAGSGELGDNTATVSSVPVDVLGAGNMVAVAAGSIHNLALGADGSVWGWGANDSYQLGDTTRRDALVPRQITGLPAMAAIAAGSDSSFALDRTGMVWSWGTNGNSGKLGRGLLSGPQVPERLAALAGVRAISATNHHALAVGNEGSVWSWGMNRYGALGDASTDDRSTPARVSGLADIIAVAAGGFHSLALGRGGAVWAWGSNGSGQLGDGTRTDRLRPVRVSGLDNVVAISAGGNNSCALTRDGRLWTWGQNGAGQLGQGTSGSPSPTPAPIQHLAGFPSFSCGDGFAVAMRADGTVWAWGRNFEGQLGDGTAAPRNHPVLTVNPAASGPLDLIPGGPNSIPPDRVPAFLATTSRAGDLTGISLAVRVRGITGSGTFASAMESGRFAAAYNVYVAASVPTGAAPLYFQLDSGNNWSSLSWPMAEFMRAVALDNQDNIVRAQILQNVDLSSPLFTNAAVIVGYGTDPDEMLRSSRFRIIFTVPEP